MIPALAIVAVLILASAALAMALRNLIYSALLLVGTWAGIACFYLWAGAEFVAFAQLLIYVGAVSMVVLFAVLLTQRSHTGHIVPPAPIERVIGAIFAGGAVAGVLVGAVMSTNFSKISTAAAPTLTVRQLGEQLMGPHAAAVLIVGVILTVALLGATILAAGDRPEKPDSAP
jgi:NADH:ubiquinone oxidoreductase subunit 6 (subunit J)